MQRTGATETAANVLRKVFPVVLLLCLAASGCGSFCASGFVNGSTSSITVSNTSCPLIKVTGAVMVQIGAASATSADSAAFPPPLASPLTSPGALLSTFPDTLTSALPNSALPNSALQGAFTNNVQHIFVTLRSIEAHPDALADEDSPAWQELAPDLSAHPVQVDLLAPPPQLAQSAPLNPLAALTTTGDSRSLDRPAGTIVPATVLADEYRQLRLRLLPRNPSPDDPIPGSNSCGAVGWNCIVFADRSVQPLEFTSSKFAAAPTRSGPLGLVATSVRPSASDAAPELHIPLERGAASIFRVLPGEVIHLSIEFDAASSVYFASNAAVRLVPVFRVVSRRSSPAP